MGEYCGLDKFKRLQHVGQYLHVHFYACVLRDNVSQVLKDIGNKGRWCIYHSGCYLLQLLFISLFLFLSFCLSLSPSPHAMLSWTS